MNWNPLLKCVESMVLLLLLLLGCSNPPEKESLPTPEIALWISGEPVLMDTLKNTVKARVDTWAIEGEISKQEFDSIVITTVSELVRSRVLRREAEKLGISVSIPPTDTLENQRHYPEGFDVLDQADSSWEDRVRNQIELMMISQEISSQMFGDVVVTDEQIKTFYEEHLQRFTIPEKYDLRVIRVNDIDLAEDIQEKVRKKWKFTTLAEKYSNLRGEEANGQLFTKHLGELPMDFETEIKELKPGKTSIVLMSQEGYYIYRMVKKHSEVVLPFEDVKDSLRSELQMREETRQFEEWLSAEEARINIKWGTPVPFPGVGK